MKKIVGLAVMVAVMFAVAAYAGTTTKVEEKVKTPTGTETVKATVQPGQVTTVDKIKTKGETEKITELNKPGETDIKDVQKFKKGEVAKVTDTIKLQKIEGDWVYGLKENKVIKYRHNFDKAKTPELLKLVGKDVKITSTHPLTEGEVAQIYSMEAAPAPAAK